LVGAALQALGIERLLLTVHDASFPADDGEDFGRGSPYSFGAARFVDFAQELGFTGLQLGPQGKTSLVNASPFDGTLFSRSTLSVALGPLAAGERWQGLLPVDVRDRLVHERPPGSRERVHPPYAFRASTAALGAAFTELGAHPDRHRALAEECRRFAEQERGWLEADSVFETLAHQYGTDDWRRWSANDGGQGTGATDQHLYCPLPGEEGAAERRRRALLGGQARAIAFHDFCQFVLHTQHAEFKADLQARGMKLFGDLQIGVSQRDLWRQRPLFLGDYTMGAPPSRTNPDGQPWGYPVLDPRLYRRADVEGGPLGDGPALAFFRARLDKMLGEFDGVRIDHPHGLCCPWVYRVDEPDPLRAVQTGARLFDSPNLPDHPALARFAIARPDQLASQPGFHRYADDWVRSLDPDQVARYAVLFDVLLETARRHGREDGDIASEVLSTCPFPLQAVLARHHLGRFRVTQKADPDDRGDAYRTDEAAPGDWVMVGTHDTPPIWRVIQGWPRQRLEAWARYLVGRLEPDEGARAELARSLEADRRKLAAALFADLFVGPARRVSVFFPDLFGMTDVYNAPGTVDPSNWTLRVPPGYRALHADRCARGEALDLSVAVATALRARARGQRGTLSELADLLSPSSAASAQGWA
jgi:4-alpha-glucanotransferase